MTVAVALLDSNVVIAILAEAHEHHAASLALLTSPLRRYALAAHSIAEAYTTLTRQGGHAPFHFTAAEAWAALESLRAVTALIGLTPSQTFDIIRSYADKGGVGPRLYDALIGQVAVVHGVPTIVTWNTRHMVGLFPELDVATPPSFLERRKGL